jgi:hypothetical protein
MLCRVDAEPNDVVGPWEIQCPHWWVQEGCCRLIEIGTEFDTPVGFDFYSEWWTGRPARTATVRRIGRGRYSVDSAEVVANPRRADEVSATWDVRMGDLTLSTDCWRSETFARATLLRPGDHLSGDVRLQLDPTHEGPAPLLRTDRIDLQVLTQGWEHLDEAPTAWTSVPAVTTEDTLRTRDDIAIVLTCTVLARTASRR